MKNNIKKIVFASLLAALTCAATLFIRMPTVLHGYINMGDCFVLVSGWLLGPVYGALAAGIGSALADVFAGYMVYTPATFVIKALMAVLAFVLRSNLSKTKLKRCSTVFSAISAEIVMVLGYFVFEGFLYGFAAVAVNIPLNLLQGAAGIVAGCLIFAALNKSKITQKLR